MHITFIQSKRVALCDIFDLGTMSDKNFLMKKIDLIQSKTTSYNLQVIGILQAIKYDFEMICNVFNEIKIDANMDFDDEIIITCIETAQLIIDTRIRMVRNSNIFGDFTDKVISSLEMIKKQSNIRDMTNLYNVMELEIDNPLFNVVSVIAENFELLTNRKIKRIRDNILSINA